MKINTPHLNKPLNISKSFLIIEEGDFDPKDYSDLDFIFEGKHSLYVEW